jgi:hypothetical protein
MSRAVRAPDRGLTSNRACHEYQTSFAAAVDWLREEQSYRAFVHLERIAGRFPYAIWRFV